MRGECSAAFVSAASVAASRPVPRAAYMSWMRSHLVGTTTRSPLLIRMRPGAVGQCGARMLSMMRVQWSLPWPSSIACR
jgi:hypothetical protein